MASAEITLPFGPSVAILVAAILGTLFVGFILVRFVARPSMAREVRSLSAVQRRHWRSIQNPPPTIWLTYIALILGCWWLQQALQLPLVLLLAAIAVLTFVIEPCRQMKRIAEVGLPDALRRAIRNRSGILVAAVAVVVVVAEVYARQHAMV